MFWQNRSAWFKGGLVGISFALACLLLIFVADIFEFFWWPFLDSFLSWSQVIFFVVRFLFFEGASSNLDVFAAYFFGSFANLFFYFGICAFCGFLCEKLGLCKREEVFNPGPVVVNSNV